jgi:hypothetical protein
VSEPEMTTSLSVLNVAIPPWCDDWVVEMSLASCRTHGHDALTVVISSPPRAPHSHAVLKDMLL